jgi:hypothetical protein
VSSEEDLDRLGREALERVKGDVARFGWHVVLISGDDEPGFLFTIGLWQTYQHPEILLFAPSPDPAGMVGRLQAVAERISLGESFEPEVLHHNLFGEHAGVFQEVYQGWYPFFLGTAMAFYDGIDFPVFQLFWPDPKGLFPWDDLFDPDLFPFQPLLHETSVDLANLPPKIAEDVEASGLVESMTLTAEDLFVELEEETKEDLLDDWRWLVGGEAEVFQVTVFGDLFTMTPDGSIHWLNTGRASYEQVAEDVEQWGEAVGVHGADWFHVHTLLELRSLGLTLDEDQVYSWRQPPILGGAETISNIDRIPATVHVSNLGRTARAIRGLPPGTQFQIKLEPF